ncbi:MAG: glycosyltransferase family 4 protein [Flavipsychrobacter sp.]|nr:glycosyltransferase family 4 protein [Flavipsychrobacter sp.]
MSPKDKTLVILTPGFPENKDDTTCLPFLQTHVRALNRAYPRLEIIILAFQYPFFEDIYKWENNEVISFGGKERGKLHRVFVWRRVWRKLRQIQKTKNIIALFSLWCTECALVGHYFGKQKDIQHYTWLCGQDAKKSNKYVKYIRPGANELIAMSDFLKREFYKNHGVEPGQVIPIGVDTNQFTAQCSERTIDVLGAGSLIPLKQYDIFTKVVGSLVQELPELQAVLCGDGPERNLIINHVIALKIQENMSLKGEVPHADVLQYMQRTKIFLHTSNYEGFGTVCLEALHAGAHVVSFTQPMDVTIPHWHHVSNKDEMVMKVKELLTDELTPFYSVTPYKADDVAIAMMALFES